MIGNSGLYYIGSITAAEIDKLNSNIAILSFIHKVVSILSTRNLLIAFNIKLRILNLTNQVIV
jgi:hypothetical protein